MLENASLVLGSLALRLLGLCRKHTELKFLLLVLVLVLEKGSPASTIALFKRSKEGGMKGRNV